MQKMQGRYIYIELYARQRRHRIDLRTGIVVSAKKSYVLNPHGYRPPGRSVFLTGELT